MPTDFKKQFCYLRLIFNVWVIPRYYNSAHTASYFYFVLTLHFLITLDAMRAQINDGSHGIILIRQGYIGLIKYC